MATDLSDYANLINKIASELQDGKIKPADLNQELLSKTLADIKKAAGDGYGDSFFDYSERPVAKLKLKQNLYRFSGAKTYQEIAKLNFFVQKGLPITELKKEAKKINQEYNMQYLETEVITAKRSGAMAEKWGKFEDQKSVYPNLMYKTVGDSRVREEHKEKNGIVKPVNDPFWDKWYPPNGHRCRCYVIQTDEDVTKGTPTGNPTPGFHGNVGKSNMAFNEDEHPYFIFPAKDAAKIRESFESLKLTSPDYSQVYNNKKAILEVSTWADPFDLEKNLNAAKVLVDQLSLSVKIKPHSEAIPNRKNPEYEINGKDADLKNVNSVNGITNGIDSAKAQMGAGGSLYSIVFRLDNLKGFKLGDITKQLANKVGKQRGRQIKSVFFVKGGKAVELTRKDLVAKDYKKLQDIL